MKAFLTGSRAYGHINDQSDIDLVVFVNRQDVEELFMLAPEIDGSGMERPMDEASKKDRTELLKQIDWDGPIACSLRFGNLNLLSVTNYVAYHVWIEGTKKLCNESPVTRKRAVEVFQELQKKHGLQAQEVLIPAPQPYEGSF